MNPSLTPSLAYHSPIINPLLQESWDLKANWKGACFWVIGDGKHQQVKIKERIGTPYIIMMSHDDQPWLMMYPRIVGPCCDWPLWSVVGDRSIIAWLWFWFLSHLLSGKPVIVVIVSTMTLNRHLGNHHYCWLSLHHPFCCNQCQPWSAYNWSVPNIVDPCSGFWWCIVVLVYDTCSWQPQRFPHGCCCLLAISQASIDKQLAINWPWNWNELSIT